MDYFLMVFDSLANYYEQYLYIIVFLANLMSVSVFSFFVPFSWFVIGGGFFASGLLEVILLLIIATVGQFLSFLITYKMGAIGLLDVYPKLYEMDSYKRAIKSFKKSGFETTGTGFISGLSRFWLSYIGGKSEFEISKYLKYAFWASLIWSSYSVFLGYIVNISQIELERGFRSAGFISLLLFGIFLVVVYRKFKWK